MDGVCNIHGRCAVGKLMSKEKEELKKELAALKTEVVALSSQKQPLQAGSETEVMALFKYMIEEREKTNKILAGITAQVQKLEKEFEYVYAEEEKQGYGYAGNREIPLSELDTKIINFVQSKGMVCADEIREFMQYRGRNAACARLNKLYKEGLLDRFQLGHKVYYKFDVGKTTNTLIISPPQ